jgi:hypothetical protein
MFFGFKPRALLGELLKRFQLNVKLNSSNTSNNSATLMAVFVASTILVGCEANPDGDDAGDGFTNSEEATFGTSLLLSDTDGDGFTNSEEAKFGTSPLLSDTDGDGYSDFQEIRELGFSATNNNFRFNPLISDVPKVAITITSIPDISINYQQTTGTAVELEVARASTFSSSESVSDTTGSSRAFEESLRVGAEVEVSSGLDGGVSATVSSDYTQTHTNESSFSNTQEQSIENSDTLREAQGLVTSDGVTLTGGSLSVTVTIENEGSIAFSIESLEMGAVLLERGKLGSAKPVGNLQFGGDTFGGDFGPGQLRELLVFNNQELSLGITEALLRDASALTVSVANSRINDEFGTSFTARETAIQATTAAIIIDYGNKNGRDTERYRIATNVNNTTKRIAGLKAIEDILNITDLTLNSAGSVISVRGVSENSLINAFWLVSHISSDGVDETINIFEPSGDGYDFENINLKAGDILQLTYLEDEDGDGLGAREEFFAGTDPTEADTDLDGLTDLEEVSGYDLAYIGEDFNIIRYNTDSNPLVSDTDNDGLGDYAEVIRGWNPADAETSGDGEIDDINGRETPRWHNNINISSVLSVTKTTSGGSKEFPRLSIVLPATPSELNSLGLNVDIYRQVVTVGTPLIAASTTTPSAAADCSGAPGIYCYIDNRVAEITDDNTNSVVFTFDDSAGAVGNQLYNYRVFLHERGKTEVIDGFPIRLYASSSSFLGDVQIQTAP